MKDYNEFSLRDEEEVKVVRMVYIFIDNSICIVFQDLCNSMFELYW